MKWGLLLRPVRYLSVGCVLVFACSVQLLALIVGGEQHSSQLQGQPALLLVTDDRERTKAEPLGSFVRRVAGSSEIAVHALSAQEVMREAGIPVSRSTLALPKIAEILVPPSIPAEAVLVRLRSRPELLVQVLSKPEVRPTGLMGAGWLLILAPMTLTGWSAHEYIRRRAPLLRLLRQIGCPPNRLAGEALMPIAASGATGAGSAALLMSVFVSSTIRPSNAAIGAVVLLAIGSALIGGLGSLRRLMAALP